MHTLKKKKKHKHIDLNNFFTYYSISIYPMICKQIQKNICKYLFLNIFKFLNSAELQDFEKMSFTKHPFSRSGVKHEEIVKKLFDSLAL